MKRGRLIVVEGGEGSGKSTIIKRLGEMSDPKKLIVTREPGGTPFAEKIRSLLFSKEGESFDAETRFHLFWAARADHIAQKIVPALEAGVDVVSDRFDMSTFAYQIFGEEHHQLKTTFRQVRESMFGGRVVPTYIYLDIDPMVGLKRKHGAKDRNLFDEMDLGFHNRVRQGYREFASIGNVRELDASRTPVEVWNDFYNGALRALLSH